ncbi:MAG: ribonuclease III [Pseudomonadota bacterium]
MGYVAHDDALMRQALRHRSASGGNNERLEFVGDAVLDSVISEALYRQFPTASEGVLSRLRSRLVRDESLAALARELELGELIELGQGERASGGARRDSILADALEAIFGAIFLEQGYSAVESVVLGVFSTRLSVIEVSDAVKDGKTALQEWLQARALPLPEYRLLETTGPQHDQVFTVRCEVSSPQQRAEATAGSRRVAEQRAATLVLAALDDS